MPSQAVRPGSSAQPPIRRDGGLIIYLPDRFSASINRYHDRMQVEGGIEEVAG